MSRQLSDHVFGTLARTTACVLLAILLLPFTLPSTAAGQTSAQSVQTDWFTNDDPQLEGPQSWWFQESSSRGHDGDYHWTTAIGDSGKHFNLAIWEMGRRVGRQELQVYVPCNHALATMTYKIQVGDDVHFRRIAQTHYCGWTQLDVFETNNREVEITLEDNASLQDFRDYAIAGTPFHEQFENGRPPNKWLDAFFGVDAMRMRCVANCATGSSRTESNHCQASPKFWSDVGEPSVGSQRLLDVYCEAATIQCPGHLKWSDVAAIALKESTHGQLPYRTADILPESATSREFDVRLKNGNGFIFSRPSGTELGPYAGLYGIPRDADANGPRYDMGPMQFAPATWEGVWRNQTRPWAAETIGHGTNGQYPDPHNFRNAVHATAAHLCHLRKLASEQPRKASGEIAPTQCAYAMYNAGAHRRLSEFVNNLGPGQDRIINCDDFLQDNGHWMGVKKYVLGVVEASGQYLSDEAPLSDAPSPTTNDRASTANYRDYPYEVGVCGAVDQFFMYQGQCTSYVAWRLNDAGIPFHNFWNNDGAGTLPNRGGDPPWSHRWSNAVHWAQAARAIGIAVDNEPRVGAVAHFTGDRYGHRTYGHVAYVEEVMNGGETIVFSEMNYDGRCGYRRVQVNRGDWAWPDNFIHFERV